VGTHGKEREMMFGSNWTIELRFSVGFSFAERKKKKRKKGRRAADEDPSAPLPPEKGAPAPPPPAAPPLPPTFGVAQGIPRMVS